MLRRLSTTVVLALWACTSGGGTPEEGPEVQSAPAAPEAPAAGPAAPAPESEARRPVVVFLGTSLTAGLGLLREDDTYVARLEEMGDSVGRPFTAVNAGVSGETSAGGLRRLDWILREPLDVLVVELGANDGLRGQPPEAMGENLTAIIRRTRERYPDVRIILAGMEAPPNLGPGYTDDFREVFTEVARTEGTRLVPFLLDSVAGVEGLNQSDGIHPNPAGHARIARTVWPYLDEALSDLGTGATP